MRPRFSLILLLILFGTPRLKGQTPAKSEADEPLKTTLCAIKAEPEKYQHKLVEFTAMASHGFEDSMVEDANCVWGKDGNRGIWLEYGGTAKTDTVYCCGPTAGARRTQPLHIDGLSIPLFEDDLFRSFNTRLHPTHARPAEGTDAVRATIQDRLFVRKGQRSQGTLWEGYGHLGCCMLFVLTRVTWVDPSPGRSLPPPPPPPPAVPIRQ